MNELALFAGAGGGILGGHLLGWRTVCAVEWNSYAASVLVARQNDRHLPAFPIWDDVQTFDGRAWRGRVDVVSGGFPCQDISAAGKGAGIDGERSSMWKHMARIIDEIRPQFAFVENSPMLALRGLGRVLGDLAELGYDARWGVLGGDTLEYPSYESECGLWPAPTCEGWGSEGAQKQLLRKVEAGELTHEIAERMMVRHFRSCVTKPSGNFPWRDGMILNLSFYEHLMAWPHSWTDIAPLATDKFQQWQRLHGVCSEGQTPIVCQGEEIK